MDKPITNDRDSAREPVVLTFHRKEGRFSIKGRRTDLHEVLAILKEVGLPVNLEYETWPCG